MPVTDICEDAEIRERIEQLKSEQESKRLAEAQRRRVRRSQSNNTRYTFVAYSPHSYIVLAFQRLHFRNDYTNFIYAL